MLPWPGPALVALIAPPISSASFLLMTRPRPVPPYLRVVSLSAWQSSGTACPCPRAQADAAVFDGEVQLAVLTLAQG